MAQWPAHATIVRTGAPSATGLGSGGAAGAQVGLPPSFDSNVQTINVLRSHSGLPLLTRPEIHQMIQAPRATVEQLELHAAREFLKHVSPGFDTTDPPPFETPKQIEFRRTVTLARKVVAKERERRRREGYLDAVERYFREKEDGDIPVERLDAFFTGMSAQEREALELVGGLGLSLESAETLTENILDGNYSGAKRNLARLQPAKSRKRGTTRTLRVERLEKILDQKDDSTMVRSYRRVLDRIAGELKKKRFSDVVLAAETFSENLRLSALHEHTRRDLSIEGVMMSGRAKDRGANRLYNSGYASVKKLHARIGALPRGSYVGDPVPAEGVRIQMWGDCKIQQTYNHPMMSIVSEQIPYFAFLRAMEHKLDRDFRSEGMYSGNVLYEDFGLKLQDVRSAKSAQYLALKLKEHGALTASIRFAPSDGRRGHEPDHAILVQGAFREDGEWHFVIVDSNHSAPRVYSFADLRLFGMKDLRAVKPKEGWTEETMRRDVRRFFETYALERPARVGFLQSVGWWLINFVRVLFGQEEMDVPTRYESDRNVVLVADAPERLKNKIRAYRARGGRLPREAVVKGPSGHTYYNRTVLDRIL